MASFEIRFDSHPEPIRAPAGTLLTDVAREAGIEIQQPCGGQGRCGRCAVVVESGQVRRRSSLRLSTADVDAGYALACQTVIEGDATIAVPPPEAIQRRLTTDHIAPEAVLPVGYDAAKAQSIRSVAIQLTPPSMDDQTDDWARLCTALRQETGVERLNASLEQIRQLGPLLRSSDWNVALTPRATAGGSRRRTALRAGHRYRHHDGDRVAGRSPDGAGHAGGQRVQPADRPRRGHHLPHHLRRQGRRCGRAA
jgi:uncharacterized 2Fe-2S/4Fe-4S cluster protein (DUF4445 family)